VSNTGFVNGIMTSSDCITWTPITNARTTIWYSVAYGNGVFLATSNDASPFLRSTDGVVWNDVALPSTTDTYKGLVYGHGIFMAMTNENTEPKWMTSPDGLVWTYGLAAPLSIQIQVVSMTYGNGLFVSVAQSGTGQRVLTNGIFGLGP
jgi:hypothetical protein